MRLYTTGFLGQEGVSLSCGLDCILHYKKGETNVPVALHMPPSTNDVVPFFDFCLVMFYPPKYSFVHDILHIYIYIYTHTRVCACVRADLS